MKTAKDWRKEIDSTLKEKANEFSKIFQSQREKDFEDLSNFSGQLEVLLEKKKELLATQEAERKNYLPSNIILNECYQKIHYAERNIEGVQKQIDDLFKKLTTIDKSAESILPFILKLIELK